MTIEYHQDNWCLSGWFVWDMMHNKMQWNDSDILEDFCRHPTTFVEECLWSIRSIVHEHWIGMLSWKHKTWWNIDTKCTHSANYSSVLPRSARCLLSNSPHAWQTHPFPVILQTDNDHISLNLSNSRMRLCTTVSLLASSGWQHDNTTECERADGSLRHCLILLNLFLLSVLYQSLLTSSICNCI